MHQRHVERNSSQRRVGNSLGRFYRLITKAKHVPKRTTLLPSSGLNVHCLLFEYALAFRFAFRHISSHANLCWTCTYRWREIKPESPSNRSPGTVPREPSASVSTMFLFPGFLPWAQHRSGSVFVLAALLRNFLSPKVGHRLRNGAFPISARHRDNAFTIALCNRTR